MKDLRSRIALIRSRTSNHEECDALRRMEDALHRMEQAKYATKDIFERADILEPNEQAAAELLDDAGVACEDALLLFDELVDVLDLVLNVLEKKVR